MRISFPVAGLPLLLLLGLPAESAHAQTTSPPAGNLATEHHDTTRSKPVTPPKAAPREPVHQHPR